MAINGNIPYFQTNPSYSFVFRLPRRCCWNLALKVQGRRAGVGSRGTMGHIIPKHPQSSQCPIWYNLNIYIYIYIYTYIYIYIYIYIHIYICMCLKTGYILEIVMLVNRLIHWEKWWFRPSNFWVPYFQTKPYMMYWTSQGCWPGK